MSRSLFLFASILFVSASALAQNEFSLSGLTSGHEDGTVLYLDFFDNTDVRDSVVVKNNSFSFKSKLANAPIVGILSTQDGSDLRVLWLENNKMTFDASGSNLKNAKVSGSKLEKRQQDLTMETAGLSSDERKAKEQAFEKDSANKFPNTRTLSTYCRIMGLDETLKSYKRYANYDKESPYEKRIGGFISLNSMLRLGQMFMDFELPNQNGTLKKLSELEGNLILLDFWASWCGPCREDHPELIEVYNQFKSKGFEIFSVSLDSEKEDWVKAINDDGLNWEQVSDLKGMDSAAGQLYGVTRGLPANWLINEKGEIIAHNLRIEELREKLGSIFK